MVQIKLDLLHDHSHSLFQDTIAVKNSQRLIGSPRLQDLSGTFQRAPCTDGTCTENFHPSVSTVGMGIHDPGGNLYKLTDMSHKKNALYAHINGHVNGLSYIIAALDIVLKGNGHMLPEIIRTVIPRCHQDKIFSLAEMLLHLHMDAFDQSLLTHGLYDPAGSKYGDPAKNAKTGIKGFLRDLLPLGNGYGKLQTALVVIFLGRLFGFPQDHGSGNRIDRRLAHVLGKSRLGDTPHTDPSVQDDPGSGSLCFPFLPGLFCR